MTALAVPEGQVPETDWTVWVDDDGNAVDRTWRNLVAGVLPWSVLDDEEMARMQLRDKNGRFSGVLPGMPAALRKAWRQETLRRADELDAQFLPSLMRERLAIAANPAVDEAVRLRAIQATEDRVRGRIPEKIEMQAEVRGWEQLVDRIVVDVPEKGSE